MKMIDQLIQLYSLLDKVMEHFKKLKKYVTDNRDLKSKEKTATQILQKLYIGSDSELASKDIKNHIDASIKVWNIIQKCYSLRETKEYLDQVKIRLRGLHEKVELFTKLGLPKPFDTSAKYIGNTHFHKTMEEKMRNDLENIPPNVDEAKVLDSIKLLISLNESLINSFLTTLAICYELSKEL